MSVETGAYLVLGAIFFYTTIIAFVGITIEAKNERRRAERYKARLRRMQNADHNYR